MHSYWWLNINPRIIRFRELDNDDIFEYLSINEDNTKRKIYSNFEETRKNDLVVVYENSEIIGFGKIEEELHNNKIVIRKIESLTETVPRTMIEERRELVNMEAFRNHEGTLFKITENEFQSIYTIIRELNPQKKYIYYEKYEKKDFLQEVFYDEKEYDELRKLIEIRKNVILQGAPGVGKTYIAKKMAFSIMGSKDESRILNIQFHENYSNDEFIEGFRPDSIGIYKFRRGCFKDFCNKARNDQSRKYFLLIDEINRGNITQIFGETFMLIEPGKRGKQNYVELSASRERFYIPHNIYIIGTMNISKRENAIVDYAVRRRFAFYTVKTIYDNPEFKKTYKNNTMLKNIIEKIKEINETLEEGQQIGHCYFCKPQTDEELKMTIKYDIIPLIEEYFYDNKRKLNKAKKLLKESIGEEERELNQAEQNTEHQKLL